RSRRIDPGRGGWQSGETEGECAASGEGPCGSNQTPAKVRVEYSAAYLRKTKDVQARPVRGRIQGGKRARSGRTRPRSLFFSPRRAFHKPPAAPSRSARRRPC